MKKPKIAFWDIETLPIKARVWSLFDTNVIDVIEDWQLLSFAYKYKGEKKAVVKSRRIYKSEKSLVKQLHKFLSQPNTIYVAHYGNGFDIKKANAKFAEYGLGPVQVLMAVDTKAVASRYFGFSSNSLNELARVLGLGAKVETGGKKLWLECEKGNIKALKKMEKYNIHDTILDEKVYNKLLPWMTNHPNINLLQGGNKNSGCPNCGSCNIVKRGFRATSAQIKQQLLCRDCSSWFLSPIHKKVKK